MPDSPQHSDKIQKDSIEELFNGRFDDDEVIAPEGVWDEISAEVATPRKPTGTEILKYASVPILAALVISAAFLWPRDEEPEPVNSEDLNEVIHESDSSAGAIPLQDESEVPNEIEVHPKEELQQLEETKDSLMESAGDLKVIIPEKPEPSPDPVHVQKDQSKDEADIDQNTESIEEQSSSESSTVNSETSEETQNVPDDNIESDPYGDLLNQGSKPKDKKEIFVPDK